MASISMFDLRNDMKMKYLLRILFTPSCWSRPYRTNEAADRFVRYLIEHKDEVTEIRLYYPFIYIKIHGQFFGLWVSNKWGAYLSEFCLVRGRDFLLGREFEIEKAIPSRETCFRFYDTFEKKMLE